MLLCVIGKLNPGLLTAQPNVAQHEVDFFTPQHLHGFLEIVDRGDDLISGVAQHIFIVECGQRLVLDDEDPLDDLLMSPEQHLHPMTFPPKRPTRPPVPKQRKVRPTVPAEPQDRGGAQRIAKLLARAGVASRREVERMIAEGRIALNGEKLTTPATLLEDLTGLTVDGKPVRPAAATRLFRFYKPQGTITAERDPKGRSTIYDRLPKGLPRLMPVGRLDFMTEGLLLLTNDGELKRQLELPRTGIVRTYRARAFGNVSQAQLEKLAEGITVEGVRYGPINANLERRTGRNCWIEMSLTEGKNREVRRVLAHLGLQVSRLIRTAYGPFSLAGLEPRAVDEIARSELDAFRDTLR
jgi:23S rRNA pseudouridine2605 synthase